MTSHRQWLAALLAGFLLGVLATALTGLTGSREAAAAEPPPASRPPASRSVLTPGLEWRLDEGVWHLTLVSDQKRFLLFHDPSKTPVPEERTPDAPFLLDVTPMAGTVDFHGGRVALFEIVPTAICSGNVCLPCDDLGLCPFPPDPDDPDGPPIKGVFLSDGR